MPRPDKDIRPGQLDGPVSSARSRSWTKYGGPETAEDHRDDDLLQDPIGVEVTVDDITVTEHRDEFASKYTTRGTSAHGMGLADDPDSPPVEVVREWIVDRTVEGRTYRRTDRLVMVELGD